MSPPPIARSIVLTDDGAMPYTAALVVFDGTVAGLTLATVLVTAHVLLSSIPGAAAALDPIEAELNSVAARLTTFGV